MITANEWFGMEWVRFKDKAILPELNKRHIPFLEPDDKAEPLKAIVNHGRWLILCDCGGAEYAWEEGMFMCLSCFNASSGHKFRKSAFPKERRKLEGILNKRILPNRNWQPPETVKDLA